jgi:hypothetical protein
MHDTYFKFSWLGIGVFLDSIFKVVFLVCMMVLG